MTLVLSLIMLVAIALVGGAIVLWRRGSARMQAVLMLVLAAIIAGNVALWVVPTSSGKAPIDRTLN